MQYALLAVLIGLIIAQFVIVWKASPNWRWYQMIPVAVLPILTVAFLFPTAAALKARSAWHQLYEGQEKQLKTLLKENKELRDGSESDPEAGDGALPLARLLRRLGLEAGRRWRPMSLAGAQFDNNVQIQLQQAGGGVVPGEPVDGEAAPPAGPLIPEGLTVYGFGEGPTPTAPMALPIFYLGEFRVVTSTPTAMTLEPTSPLTPAQRTAIETRQASTWSVYELLPLDGHVPFVAEGSVPDDDNLFGRMDTQLIGQLLGNKATEATLREYVRDGTRRQADDPPSTHWVKIKFLKKTEIEVNSSDPTEALFGGFFDGSGRAVDGRLQTGEDKIVFEIDDQLVVKKEAADALISDGSALPLNDYFVRPLNDYRYVLRKIRLRLAELEIRSGELRYEARVLQEAIDATTTAIAANQSEKLKLEQDQIQTEKEAAAMNSYNERLTEQVNDKRRTLVNLYRSNLQLESELQAATEQIVQQRR